MSHTIYAGKIAKRKNSTLQPTLNTSFDVLLKTPTSLHKPTFTINAASFDYNYLKWGDRYYFVTDVTSRNNNLWEVSAIVDVLATFKADILASTQFVCYSSHNSNTWLPDTRIPLVKATTTNRETTSMAGLFNDVGFYVLTAVGLEGCVAYAVDKATLNAILASIQDWEDDGVMQALNQITAPASSYTRGAYRIPASNGLQDCFQSLNEELVSVVESLGDMFTDFQQSLSTCIASIGGAAVTTGFLGNAYSLAPECIRSCIWVPFFASPFADTGKDLYLGNLPCKDAGGTMIRPFTLKANPVTGSVTINIPWHYSDWRRGICEDVYLYLPMVGMIQLSATSLTNVSSITVSYSATATDGVVCYEVKAGGNVIGTYSGQCSANYPIGINQQASAGEIAQSFIGGVDKVVAAAVHSSISPISMGATAASAIWNSATAGYEVANTANSTHLTCVGGIGGGAGSGLDLDLQCYTVCHETVMTPSDMAATMGLPTMLPYPLATLTGYCQCANAHVAASGAESQELDEIDAFLNSGFYIE